ncbi:hypothetical protein HDE_12902 [Halotydeus destructor]|nr:hypothetical protein HDE_12902 [Halotydeus destructor]
MEDSYSSEFENVTLFKPKKDVLKNKLGFDQRMKSSKDGRQPDNVVGSASDDYEEVATKLEQLTVLKRAWRLADFGSCVPGQDIVKSIGKIDGLDICVAITWTPLSEGQEFMANVMVDDSDANISLLSSLSFQLSCQLGSEQIGMQTQGNSDIVRYLRVGSKDKIMEVLSDNNETDLILKIAVFQSNVVSSSMTKRSKNWTVQSFQRFLENSKDKHITLLIAVLILSLAMISYLVLSRDVRTPPVLQDPTQGKDLSALVDRMEQIESKLQAMSANMADISNKIVSTEDRVRYDLELLEINLNKLRAKFHSHSKDPKKAPEESPVSSIYCKFMPIWRTGCDVPPKREQHLTPILRK